MVRTCAAALVLIANGLLVAGCPPRRPMTPPEQPLLPPQVEDREGDRGEPTDEEPTDEEKNPSDQPTRP